MFIDQQEKWKEMTPDGELNEMVQVLTVVQYSRSLLHRVVSMSLYSISAIAAMIKARAVSLNEEQIQNIETETVESIFSKAMKHVIEISKDDLMEVSFRREYKHLMTKSTKPHWSCYSSRWPIFIVTLRYMRMGQLY